jgi:hypothetical protein
LIREYEARGGEKRKKEKKEKNKRYIYAVNGRGVGKGELPTLELA